MEFDPWTQSLLAAMSSLWASVAAFIPRLFGALVVVLLGFVVAKLLDTLLSKVLAKLGLDRLMAGTGLTKLLGRAGIRIPVSALIGKVVYWFVLLIFLVSAAESLGLERVSATLDMLALYVPKVFGAALILLAGVLLAQVLSGLVRGAAESVGLDYANGLARIAQGLVIIISISVAIGQLEVKTELLNYVIAIVLITFGLAVALAFGLGSRELVGQILAGIYVRELYEVGQRVRLADIEGQIEEIGTVKTLLLTDDGELASVANKVLLEQRVGVGQLALAFDESAATTSEVLVGGTSFFPRQLADLEGGDPVVLERVVLHLGAEAQHAVLAVHDHRHVADDGELDLRGIAGDPAGDERLVRLRVSGGRGAGVAQELLAVQHVHVAAHGDGDGRRAVAGLEDRLDGGGAERGGFVRGEDPDPAVGRGDDDAVPADADGGLGRQLHQARAGSGCGVDGGHAARPGLEDVVAGLDDVEVLAGGGDAGVELARVDVQAADEAAVAVADPDAAVGDLDLRGGEAVVVHGEAGEDERHH